MMNANANVHANAIFEATEGKNAMNDLKVEYMFYNYDGIRN